MSIWEEAVKRTLVGCSYAVRFRTNQTGLAIIFRTFQGQLRAQTQQVLVRTDEGSSTDKPRFDIDRGQSFSSQGQQLTCNRHQINRVSIPLSRS